MELRRFVVSGFLVMLVFAGAAHASETNGNIDTVYKYAWGENIGWINFGCDTCNVAVTDQGLFGYAWSRQYGWIHLAPDNGGVDNDGEGTLSGYAWGSNVGWINFTGVIINNTGEFSGYATVESDGSRINFNCATGASCASSDFKIKTDWRPASSRSGGTVAGSTPRPAAAPGTTYQPHEPGLPANSPDQTPPSFAAETREAITEWLRDIFSRAGEDAAAVTHVPAAAPPSLSGAWNIIPVGTIASFVFAPLPYEIRMLASKFPELHKTLSEFGVEKLSDIGKLSGVSLNIPSLAELLNQTISTVGLEEMAALERLKSVRLELPGISRPGTLPASGIGAGTIALIEGLPVADFSLSVKKNLPAEFVFARTADETVDLGVELAVDEEGAVSQRLSTLPGKTTKLVIKPLSPAKNVTGYVVFLSPAPKVTRTLIERSSLAASALFSMDGLVEKVPAEPVERKLVVASFEYSDPDGDGIYTADVTMPAVPGEYEIVTIIDYLDPELGRRKIEIVTVIDPEGYVYEKNDGKETRIPGAVVSLYALDRSTGRYELWDAKSYSQDNPQITDIRGTYSFLVPAGSYYFEVSAPGYEPYAGEIFAVTEGNGVHTNIPLELSGNWLGRIDWQTSLLIVVILLLLYNLYSNNLRNKVFTT